MATVRRNPDQRLQSVFVAAAIVLEIAIMYFWVKGTKDLGPVLYLLIGGLVAYGTAEWLAYINWKREGDFQSFVIVVLSVPVGFIALAVLGCQSYMPRYIGVPIGFLVLSIATAYAVAYGATAVVSQASKHDKVSYLGYGGVLIAIVVLWFFWTSGSLRDLPWPLVLVKPAAIAAGWFAAPAFVRQLRLSIKHPSRKQRGIRRCSLENPLRRRHRGIRP